VRGLFGSLPSRPSAVVLAVVFSQDDDLQPTGYRRAQALREQFDSARVAGTADGVQTQGEGCGDVRGAFWGQQKAIGGCVGVEG
jgi:hypothetical protein